MDREGTVRFIALRGVEGKREYPVKADRVLIGSAEVSDPAVICIDGEGVLPRHALFVREGDAFRLEPEAGATVIVNREAFAGGPIYDGDQIAFGRALFQFWAGGLQGRPPRPYTIVGSTAPGERHADASRMGAEAPRRNGRRPRRWLLLAALIAIAAAVVLVLLLRGSAVPP